MCLCVCSNIFRPVTPVRTFIIIIFLSEAEAAGDTVCAVVALLGINPHFPTALHFFGLNICILSGLSACIQVSLFLVHINRKK